MTRVFAAQFVRRAPLLALLFFALAATAVICGCRRAPSSPAPSELSLGVGCVDGRPVVQVVNDGGKMTSQSTCSVEYEDGTSDSLIVELDAGGTLTCQLSNMHGSVTVSIVGTSLSASAGDCVSTAFQGMLETYGSTVDLAGLVPTPLLESDMLGCHYQFYLENIAYGMPVVSVTQIDGGMALQETYANFSGDLRAESSGGFVCLPYSGTMTIGSIVYNAEVMFNSGSPVLVNSDVSVNDLDIQIDGVLGFLTNWIVDYFESGFASAFESEFAAGFQGSLEPALSGILADGCSCE